MRKIPNAIIKSLLVLIIISTFLFTGLTVYASSDNEILTVNKYVINGETLHVTVTDNKTGTTYEIELNLRDHLDETDEYITLQAQDNNGNISNSIQFKNPFYSPDAKPSNTPTFTNTNPFTPDGTGTVVNNATEEDGKEFYSITTDNGNIFYLIVDKQRNSNNIYLLNAVTEKDLLPFINPDENITPPLEIANPIPEPTPTPTPAPEPVSKESNAGMIILLILIIGGIIGAAYYIKVVKPKQEPFDEDFGSEEFIKETDETGDTENIDFSDDEDDDPNI